MKFDLLGIAGQLHITPSTLLVGIFAIIVWSICWKGISLWTAARRGEWIWFVLLLLINTVGILEMLYVYVFSKKNLPNISS